MNQRLDGLHTKMRQQNSTLQWLQTQYAVVQDLQLDTVNNDANMSASLEAVVSRTSKQYNVQITRIQQKKENIALTIKPLEFNLLLNWLAEMDKNYGVKVRSIQIERQEEIPGSVMVKSLQLGRQE